MILPLVPTKVKLVSKLPKLFSIVALKDPNAELLKTSKISKSNKIVNSNTSASIQSGFYFGYLHAVNGILKQIIKENNFKPKVYITGGLGKIFRDKIIYKPIYMEHLTLEGIKEIGIKYFYE